MWNYYPHTTAFLLSYLFKNLFARFYNYIIPVVVYFFVTGIYNLQYPVIQIAVT